MIGRIKNVKSDRGFGFIKPDGGIDQVFFHARHCYDNFEHLAPDDRVQFDVEDNPRRPGTPMAINVQPLD